MIHTGLHFQRLIASGGQPRCEIAQKASHPGYPSTVLFQLALGYPKGPLAFGEHLQRSANILTVLNNLAGRIRGEPRYLPAPGCAAA